MLEVGALVPHSTRDFPGKPAAVVYLHGCPWECVYCHEPALQPRPAQGNIPWAKVMEFLRGRREDLGAVVFSGGEPTLHASLGRAMAQVRKVGYQVGLHTAGIYPRRLALVLPQLDWMALDVKGPIRAYPGIVNRVTGADAVLQSLGLVIDSGIPFEARTTWHPGLFPEAELLEMARELAGRGVRRYALQLCESPRGAPRQPGYPPPDATLLEALEGIFEHFTYRESEAVAWP